MGGITSQAYAILTWIGFAVGVSRVFITWRSVVNTVILPRAISSQITYRTWLAVIKSFRFVADRLPHYEAKDRFLAYLGPVALLFALLAWLALFFIGYALIFWPLLGGDLGAALTLSGSSMFTLGVASSGRPGPTAIEFIAAATGIIIVALQIGYLPSIYSAYNRRETLVTALNTRAGAPAWGPEILARHHLDRSLSTLSGLYAAWESCAADIAESHTSYPWLMSFRSPVSLHSWVISLLAMLDSAALYLALCPASAPVEAGQCLRMGFIGLRTLAHAAGIPVNDDPRPDEPIALPYEAYLRGVESLRVVGFPLERSAEDAWADFKGWRVNYEAAAFGLAEYTVAVPAPWSGKRSHMTRQEVYDVLSNRPRHRTPEDPEGLAVLRTQRPLQK